MPEIEKIILPIPEPLRSICNRQTIIINYINNKPVTEIYKEWVKQCLDAIKEHHIINMIENPQMDYFTLNISHIHNQTDITTYPLDEIEDYSEHDDLDHIELTDSDFIRPYLIPLIFHYLNQTVYKNELDYQQTFPSSLSDLLNQQLENGCTIKDIVQKDIITNTDLFESIRKIYRLNKEEALNQIFLYEVI